MNKHKCIPSAKLPEPEPISVVPGVGDATVTGSASPDPDAASLTSSFFWEPEPASPLPDVCMMSSSEAEDSPIPEAPEAEPESAANFAINTLWIGAGIPDFLYPGSSSNED